MGSCCIWLEVKLWISGPCLKYLGGGAEVATGHARSSFRAGGRRVRSSLLLASSLGLGLVLGGWARPWRARSLPWKADAVARSLDPRRRTGADEAASRS